MNQGLPVLQLGAFVAEVGNWQRFLNKLGHTDAGDVPLVEDEHFGRKTAFATRTYQWFKKLPTTGVVDDATRNVARLEGFIPFIQAKGYNALPARKVRLLVIHTMESSEKPGTAEQVALWFAGRTRYEAPRASAHYCIDPVGVVQCVRERDVAWAAPGANNDGIHLELAGRAGQSAAEWQDDTSEAILANAARLGAEICLRHGLPIKKLVKQEILAGEAGVCGHADITAAYPGPGRTHWDPGPRFPYQGFLERLMRELTSLQETQKAL